MEPDRTDCKLVLRLRNGDAGALDAILRLFWHQLVDYASALGVDRDTAQDVAQQVLVRLWERREVLRLEGSLRGLLYRMARNLCVDLSRQRKARERVARRSADPLHVNAPHDRIVGAELGAIIARAVNALPKRRREVFVLIRYHGLTHRETAKVLDLAPQTVANHLGMALTDLRKTLARYLPDYHHSSDLVTTCPRTHRAVGGFGQ